MCSSPGRFVEASLICKRFGECGTLKVRNRTVPRETVNIPVLHLELTRDLISLLSVSYRTNRVPNRLTRVPELPPPSLEGFGWLVSLADMGMKLFYSTPKSGTLGNTWVTPATLLISALATLGSLALVLICALQYTTTLASWAVVLIILACCTLAVVCAAITCTGALQRLRANHDGDSRG